LDAIPLAYDPGCNRQLLHHERQFVTKENVVELVSNGLHSLAQSKFEVLSIDVDGNDGYLAESLLSAGFGPEVIIIETNEILPPPIRFTQPYVADYVWQKSRCFGWSLQSIADLLKPYGYFCVACNLQTGVNAFFAHSEHLNLFLDVPSELSEIYVGRAGHPYKYKDHRTSATPDLVEEILRNTNPL